MGKGERGDSKDRFTMNQELPFAKGGLDINVKVVDNTNIFPKLSTGNG
jgi:hypothetical protein